jgi:hypothetical protein
MSVKNDSIMVVSIDDIEQPVSPKCTSQDETRLATLSSFSSSLTCNSKDETRLFTGHSTPKCGKNDESFLSTNFPVTSTPVTGRGISVTEFFSNVNDSANSPKKSTLGKYRCCFGNFRAMSPEEVAAHQYTNHLDRFGTKMVLTKCCPYSNCHFKTNDSERMEEHLQFSKHRLLAASDVRRMMATNVYKCQFATIHLFGGSGAQYVDGCVYQCHTVRDLIIHYIMHHTQDLKVDRFLTPEFKPCTGNKQ